MLREIGYALDQFGRLLAAAGYAILNALGCWGSGKKRRPAHPGFVCAECGAWNDCSGLIRDSTVLIKCHKCGSPGDPDQ